MGEFTTLHRDEFAGFLVQQGAEHEVFSLAHRIVTNPTNGILSRIRFRRDVHVLEGIVTITEAPALDEEGVHFTPVQGRELAGFLTELEQSTN